MKCPSAPTHHLLPLTRLLFLSLSVALFGPAPAPAQTNAITVSRNLAELVAESGVVVQGRVVSATLAAHPQLRNLLTLTVTLQVEDQLKGAPAKSLTFHQAVVDSRDRETLMGYRAGQHLLLLLMPENGYGLTSTAGLHQGRFQITADRRGRLSAVNGLGNAGLFRGMASQMRAGNHELSPEAQSLVATPGSGPVPLDSLKSLIRAISAGAQR
jgi:hypothetical protein